MPPTCFLRLLTLFFYCVLRRTRPTRLERHNKNVNAQHLYLITATMAPSVSIKALTPGSGFYFVLKVCRRRWKCHCAYAPLHYLELHIYFTGDECVTIWKVISPRGLAQKQAAPAAVGVFGPIWQPGGSFMSPVRREMASWATFTRPHWSCCQSSSRTTTAAYHDRESCEDGSVRRCVWATHTHTHLCELWGAAWRCEGGPSEAESSSEKTQRAETHGGSSVRRREGNKRSLSTQEAADLLSAAF